MRVLLSAYACEPNKGSEPGVGWHWAIEIAKLGHEVFVITRSNNSKTIEAESSSIPVNLHFIYYDLPTPFVKLKKYLGIYLYYTFWQLGAYREVKRIINVDFDIIHHITFVSYRFPVFMHKLKGRFILGPVAGGEESSPNLTSTLSPYYRVIERARKVINHLNRLNIFMNKAYKRAERVYVATEDTFTKIPSEYYYKTTVTPAIGINCMNPLKIQKNHKFTILYAGQLLHWKGIHIALEAYAKALKINPDLHFKVIGTGKFKDQLLQRVAKLKIGDKVEFIERLPQKQLFEEYQKSHLFLFPSIHDSGGFVVLESMSCGLPVICLDKGGPPNFVGKDSDNVIKTAGKTMNQIIDDISELIITYSQNQELLKSESSRVRLRSQEFEWKKIVGQVYEKIQSPSLNQLYYEVHEKL